MTEAKKKVDDDWKRKAGEEKAKLEVERERIEHEVADADAEADAGLPPATFEGLVSTLALQAAIALGDIKSPLEQEKRRDLPAARYVIDTLAMLSEKTRGNLEHGEELSLKNLLTELRFKYVQAAGGAS